MSVGPSGVAEMIARLGHGWPEASPGPALEALDLLAGKLGGELQTKGADADTVEFRLHLNQIRLRGADDIFGILVGGNGVAAMRSPSAFWSRSSAPGRLVMILAGSETAHRAAEEKIPQQAAFILGPRLLERLLADPNPLAYWKAQLCHQVSKSRLLPFDIEHPAAANMFFGRQAELDLLAGADSIAIAGPGRIGKTSLLHEHRRRLLKTDRARAIATTLIDFYSCADKSDDHVAHFLMMKINPTRRNSNKKAADLGHILLTERSRHSCVPELLLDEVDEVVSLPVFNQLAKAARDGLCRLILVGRGVLFQRLSNKNSALECRIDMIRPEPLDRPDAESLFIEPFRDLGYRFVEEDRFLDYVMDLTGGLPQHLHLFGRRLFHCVTTRGLGTISPEIRNHLKDDFQLAHYVRSSLLEVEPEYQPIAELLLTQGRDVFTDAAIQDACVQAGRARPTLAQAVEIGDQLVLQNFLVWRGDRYRLASPALLGYFPDRPAASRS